MPSKRYVAKLSRVLCGAAPALRVSERRVLEAWSEGQACR